MTSDGAGGKPVEFTPAKSGKARTVDLDHKTVESLLAHRDRQDAERVAAGDRWQADLGGRLVFARDSHKLPEGATAGGRLHSERDSLRLG